MAKSIISPFDGRPLTQSVVGSDGKVMFRVFPRELTPVRAIVADWISILSCLGGSTEVTLYLQTLENVANWVWFAAIAGPWALYPFAMRFVRVLARKQVRIVMTGAQFSFKTWRGWKTFDRRLPHRFSLTPHRLGRKEQQSHQLAIQRAAQKGRIITLPAYFAESYHLIFEYLGQAQDITAIYDRDRAMKVLARLKACNDVLDNETGHGDGIALEPEEQWTEQPGEIPETE